MQISRILLFGGLFLALFLAGCTAQVTSNVSSNCRDEPVYETKNQANCDYTTSCNCIDKNLVGQCVSCQCQVGTKKVCE